MRLLIITSALVTLLFVTACNNRPQTVAGSWLCTTTHPGGFASRDTFQFGDKGDLTLDSGGVVMHGTYVMDGTRLTMQLSDVPVPDPEGRMVTQRQSLNATIQKLTKKELAMDVSTGKNLHQSQCSRS